MAITKAKRAGQGGSKDKGKQIATSDHEDDVLKAYIAQKKGKGIVIGDNNYDADENRKKEVRSKHRNDELMSAMKRALMESMLDGVLNKRKKMDVVENPEQETSDDSIKDGGSPVAVVKKTRYEKRKEGMVNYEDLVVRPYADYPTLFTRTTPSVLVKAMEDMNEQQKNAVSALGFDHLLDLTIKELPGKLNYWLIHSYNARTSEIVLPSGKTIPVTEEDVYRVLGFPRGYKNIDLVDNDDITPLFEDWKARFPGRNPRRIKVHEIRDDMLACQDGGQWFKIQFMLMVAHCLIESSTNGSIVPRIIRCLEDLDGVKEWNWAEYVIKSLITSKGTWQMNTKQFFTGPTMFMTILYVDRLNWVNSNVKRDFPLFKSWNTKKLKDRELEEINGGKFGDGIILDPITIYGPDLPPYFHVDEAGDTEHVADERAGIVTDETILSRLTREMVQFEKSRDKIMGFLNIADDADLESCAFKQKFEEAKKLMVTAPFMLTKMPVDKLDNDRTAEMLVHTATEKTPVNNVVVVDGLRYDDEMLKSCDEAVTKTCSRIDHVDDLTGFNLGASDLMGTETTHGTISGVMDTVGAVPKEVGLDGGCQTPLVRKEFRVEDLAANTSLFNLPVNANRQAEEAGKQHVQPPRGPKTNIAGIKRKDGKENRVYENPKTVVLGACVANETEDRCVLKTRVENTILQTPSPLGPKCRGKELLRRTSFNLSPFVERTVNTTKRLTKREKAIGLFALYYRAHKPNDIIFEYEKKVLRRDNFVSLCRGNIVDLQLIDTWTVFLNWNEQFRADTSPSRFFASTQICLESIVQPPSTWTYKKRRDIFMKLLTAELGSIQHTLVNAIDMFFFPVCRVLKYYALCVDLKKERIYVLDSQNESQAQMKEEKYSRTVDDLRQMLVDYMTHMKEVHKSIIVKRSRLSIIHIKWGDSKNINDTGVYLMRHMETFMGEGASSWSCGLTAKLKKQLDLLRVRYCATIVGWEKNSVKDLVTVGATDYYEEVDDDPSVNIDFTLLG
ncbi:uncharacterized protein LOC131023533 [Salvia miltiorrhiza]|uniref:uncharacterized protein LOC131023533 n=1 Tax=Salvia miltiorrhiza TaxID=226208 RepID=UPI0025AC319C|nr:uncharacterized protein LOC131023533 [Salvia miltiorrhiza]